MNTTTRPKMITQGDYITLLGRPGITDRLPEFRALQQPAVKPMPRQGCRSCAKRRETRNMFSAFLGIVSKLNPEALARLKQELGAPSLMLYGLNAATGQYEMRTI